MSMIDVKNLTFEYEGSYDPIFENTTFRIDTDWKLGFTGRNGRGKTTFLNLLRGKYKYSGKISASVEFDYFPYEVEDETRTTIEIVYDINPYLEYWMLQREFSLLKIDEDVLERSFKTLSQGEQTKVLLAAMFTKTNNFLLIDEPTNHLDSHGRELLEEYLSSKKSFILVSHDRHFLDSVIDHILVINKTKIEIQQGDFSDWWYNKTVRDQFEISQNEKLKKNIKRLERSAKQSSGWSDKVEKTKVREQNGDAGVKPDKGHLGALSAKMMKRAKNAENRKEKAIQERGELLKDIETMDPLSIDPLPYHKSRLIYATDLSLSYPGKEVLTNLSFSVEEGNRIRLIGKNGSGKSSLIKLLLNADSIKGGALGNMTISGNLDVGSNLKISYVPQDTSALNGSLSDYAESLNIDEGRFKSILRKMDFPRIQFEKNMEDFSQGQKKKVYLAGSLCESANLYIWDEPLNHIDIYTRMQIEKAILESNPTMIFVDHDKEFGEVVATDMLYL